MRKSGFAVLCRLSRDSTPVDQTLLFNPNRLVLGPLKNGSSRGLGTKNFDNRSVTCDKTFKAFGLKLYRSWKNDLDAIKERTFIISSFSSDDLISSEHITYPYPKPFRVKNFFFLASGRFLILLRKVAMVKDTSARKKYIDLD